MSYDPYADQYNLEALERQPLPPRTDSWGHQEVPSVWQKMKKMASDISTDAWRKIGPVLSDWKTIPIAGYTSLWAFLLNAGYTPKQILKIHGMVATMGFDLAVIMSGVSGCSGLDCRSLTEIVFGFGVRRSKSSKKSKRSRKSAKRVSKGKKGKSNIKNKKPKPAEFGQRYHKPILQYDLKGNFLKEWPSIKEASQSLNIGSGSISMCCRGKIKYTHNNIFKFK